LLNLRLLTELAQPDAGAGGRGFEVVLVSPKLAPLLFGNGAGGSVSDLLPKEVRMDVRYLVRKGGGRFVKDRAKEIRPKDQEVTLLLVAATPAIAARRSERSGR
jgi:hypothetical protein